jgi:uncharacterized protein YukE
MADGITVDPVALRTGGAQLQQVAAQLRTQWATFSGQVQAMGDIFGDDQVGGLIGASYGAAHEIADSCFTSVADAFDGFGTGLSRCADNHERTDQDIAGGFDRMMR